MLQPPPWKTPLAVLEPASPAAASVSSPGQPSPAQPLLPCSAQPGPALCSPASPPAMMLFGSRSSFTAVKASCSWCMRGLMLWLLVSMSRGDSRWVVATQSREPPTSVRVRCCSARPALQGQGAQAQPAVSQQCQWGLFTMQARKQCGPCSAAPAAGDEWAGLRARDGGQAEGASQRSSGSGSNKNQRAPRSVRDICTPPHPHPSFRP